jgi:hypothetical protein
VECILKAGLDILERRDFENILLLGPRLIFEEVIDYFSIDMVSLVVDDIPCKGDHGTEVVVICPDVCPSFPISYGA